MKLRTLGAVAVLVLTVAGCGNEEGDASKAIADSMLENSDNTFQVSQEEANCVGDGIVDDIGVDQLKEYGILNDDLETDQELEGVEMSQDDAEAAAGVMLDCADIKSVFTEAMGEVPAEVQSCIDDKLTDDVLHEFLVAVFRNDQEGGTQGLMGALQECMTA